MGKISNLPPQGKSSDLPRSPVRPGRSSEKKIVERLYIIKAGSTFPDAARPFEDFE